MKTYYESVEVNINLETLVVTTTSNILKHYGSKRLLDPNVDDIENDIIPEILNKWIPSDRCQEYFESSDEVTATRTESQVMLKVAKGQDTLSFQFDTENNILTILGTTLIRMTRITVTGGEDLVDLLGVTLPLYVSAIMDVPNINGTPVFNKKG